ncbi:cation diffusion facilitator family transporter [Tenacibaculum sp. UWU-22]|uniref:cation diffusion facilitator family transporter n=1 Tax=Tenacibaculum sp. UWU-22 TaxID=3234187 RepID=UPI0034DB33A8
MTHNHTGHNHEDHHHHSVASLSQINNAFYIGIFLNAAYTLIEYIVGLKNNSLALIADATHNLSDVASLIISLIGLKLMQKAATKVYTYGYKKASILASLINAVLLIIVVINIVKASVERFNNPPEITGKVIIITATIGVFINTISAFLFFKGQKDDINVKGAFLHLVVDALVSFGVVISGIVIYYTGWNIIDPFISLIIALVIIFSTWGLLKESVKLSLDGVPKDIDTEKINTLLLKNPLVKEVHHTHIWAISTNTNALTTHIYVDTKNYTPEIISKLKKEINHQLAHQNIQHVTLQFETSNDKCVENNCD